jgi:hypothetical protein
MASKSVKHAINHNTSFTIAPSIFPLKILPSDDAFLRTLVPIIDNEERRNGEKIDEDEENEQDLEKDEILDDDFDNELEENLEDDEE